MAEYSTIELLSRIAEIADAGYSLVDITELEGDEECPVRLSFEVEYDDEFIDYECVDSIDSDSYTVYTPTTNDKIIAFSLTELANLSDFVAAALEHYKALEKEPSISRNKKDEIKRVAIDARNMQAKIKKTIKCYK